MAFRRIAVLGACLCASLVWSSQAGANHSITALLSTGPSGGNGAYDAVYKANSREGAHVLFGTQEQLAPADTDSSTDVYDTFGTVSSLVSIGPSGGNGAFGAFAAGLSDDGSHAFFDTSEQLVPEDTDGQPDLYERAGGATSLVSTGPAGGNGAYPVYASGLVGSSADGAHVFFQTGEQLVAEDTDSAIDVYERTGGTTALVSTGPTGGNGNADATADAVSTDGSRAVFETTEQLTAEDTDSEKDIYVRAGGTTELLSIGVTIPNDASPVFFGGASDDATSVAFSTEKTCYNGYFYTCRIVWLRSGGSTAQISRPGGNFTGISQNGQHVFYESEEADAPGSADYCGQDPYGDYFFGCPDLFDYSAGTVRTVTYGGIYDCTGYVWGNECYQVEFGGASADGTHVFFNSWEPMAAGDSDACLYDPENQGVCNDVFENTAAGGTRLISRANTGSGYAGNSEDGSRVFFSTSSAVLAGDTDGNYDIYERYMDAYTLISTGPSGGNGPFNYYTNSLKGTSADGTRVFFETGEKLVPRDTDANVDIYHARVGSGYPAPRGAGPMYVSLVPAYQACTASNRSHGSPLAFPSCAPPALASPNLTVGVGDGTPPVARSIASLRLAVHPGASGPPDDSDVTLRFSITNVFNSADLSDYTGELDGRLTVRLTDRQSSGPGTTSDFPFAFKSGCAATADTLVGATCSLNTTFNAVLPGSVVDAQRAIWGLDQARIYDGGPDGDADTPDNSLFEVQGVFVP